MKPKDEAARRRHRNERIAAAALVIALAGLVAAFNVWNQREEQAFRSERTYVPRPEKITPEIELLREYLRIDTSNPPGREAAGAQWISQLLARNGIASQVIDSAPGRSNVYARIRGKRPGEGLLLLHHIDVVPAAAEGWKRPPFAAEVYLNELYGRGVLDMKGIGITHLLAFIDVARDGRQPERDIVLLAVADEETGGEQGMEWLLENRPELFDGIRYAVGEGGVVEVTAEKVTYFGIEIGNKQFGEGRVSAPSIDALRQARFALAPWNVRRDPDRILPEVKRFMADIAPTRKAFRDELADVDRAIATGTFWRLPVAYRQLTQNVAWMTDDRAIDGRATATLYMLLLPDEPAEQWIDRVKRKIAPYDAELSIVSVEPATPLSPIDTPMYRLIASQARRQFGGRTGTMILHKQSNDSRFLRRRGIAAYGVQPFPIDVYQSNSMHGIDERLRLNWFMEGVAFMRQLVARWAFAR